MMLGRQVPAPLVGRDDELAFLTRRVDRALAGVPAAVLVHGEAGIGKTRLVREASAVLPPRTVRMRGVGLRMGSVVAPYSTVTMALRDAVAERPDLGVDVDRVLERLDTDAEEPPGRLVPVVANLVERVADEHGVVLVVDDLQWADPSTLDVLAYLVAGLRHQRLALLGTYRDEGLAASTPAAAWLADLHRLVQVEEVALTRLPRAATEEQVAGLLGYRPDPELAAEVGRRSAGNPYLTELLVAGLDPDATALDEQLPAGLRMALTGSWHRLPERARDLLQLVSVAGRPVPYDVLQQVAARHRGVEGGVVDSLRRGVEQGLVLIEGDTYWFRHPLVAEVLYTGLVPGEPEAMHAAWAGVMEDRVDWPGGLDRAVDLARHHRAAGHDDAAFRWSLRAADMAHELRAFNEEAAHLRTAIGLRDAVRAELREGVDVVDLSLRAAYACRCCGDPDAEVAILEAAAPQIPAGRPLTLAKVLTCLVDALITAGRAFFPLDLANQAVALTDGHPESGERAMALAVRAQCLRFHYRAEEAMADSLEALAIAERHGDPVVIAEATAIASLVASDAPIVASERAYRMACEAGDVQVLAVAGERWAAQFLEHNKPEQAAEVAREVLGRLLAEAPGLAGWSAGLASVALFELGRWDECAGVLRDALSLRLHGIDGGIVRNQACWLAAGRGDERQARQHLARAMEHVPTYDRFPGLGLNCTRAAMEVLTGHPVAALDLMDSWDWHQNGNDTWFLAYLARAAADVAVVGRARREPDRLARALAVVEALDHERVSNPDVASPGYEVRMASVAHYQAECARALDVRPLSPLWREAVTADRSMGAAFDEAYASWRLGEALLHEGGPRRESAAALRAAHRLATGMGAEPLRRDVEHLAVLGQVDLREVAEIPPPSSSVLAGLTAREREVLGHLAAGRTNREIADALVVSEKTVSVHVSNILRKTGTSNRMAAAELVSRLGEA